MKIHRIYNDLNESEDILKGKVQIEMSSKTWYLIKEVIFSAKIGYIGSDYQRLAIKIYKIIREAEDNETTEWAK